MRYRINQIKLNIEDSVRVKRDSSIFAKTIQRKLKKRNLKIYDIEIIKESIDARRKPDVKLVYTLDFSCEENLTLNEAVKKDYDSVKKEVKAHIEKRPVVIGFGPAGMFAALILAEAGKRPIVIERGQSVEDRVETVERFWTEGVLDTESNVQFGEGGAGTFSDGKLTTGIKDIRISKVLKEFVKAGADEEILYKQKPHIGTDKLRTVVKNIRKKVEELGGEIRFNTKLERIITQHNKEYDVDMLSSPMKIIKGIETVGRDGRSETIDTDHIVLAIGHSARDTFKMLFDEGVEMEQKPFSIGVRIEHPQRMIDERQYGDAHLADILGAADYKLSHRCENGRGVYTFCMCPGGIVINAASEEKTAVTNGMSNSKRDEAYANSGLLVDVRCEDFSSDHPLAGVEFQRKYERLAYENGKGSLPKTNYENFKADQNNTVRKCLPDFASEAIIEAMPFLGRKLRGFDSTDALMTAVETRSSSPVRILREKNHEAVNVKGVYPAGEGAGYAGGIMSAAVDGIKTAEKILNVIFF